MSKYSTRLLVSVRDAAEAEMALAAGVDLIDIKEPRLGSLGAASMENIQAIVQCVANRAPLSVALGELLHNAGTVVRALADDETGATVTFAKVGLAGCANEPDWPHTWSRCFELLSLNVHRVACVYADQLAAHSPTLDEVLRQTVRRGARALLIDTFDKRGPGLLRLWPLAEITRAVKAARDDGLLVVLAGQLSIDDLPHAIACRPDYVAVRGAACVPDRNGQLDVGRLRAIQRLLRGEPSVAKEFS